MINSITPSDGLSGTSASANGPSAPAASAVAASAWSGDIQPNAAEAVSVSADASATTKLLNAARDADGVNQSSVAALRAAMQNGTYNVSPEDLAQSIIRAVQETPV